MWPYIANAFQEPDKAPLIQAASTEGIALVAPPPVLVEPKKPVAVASVACGIKAGDFTVEHAMVIAAFPDAPIMVDIARAESRFDPTAKNCGSTATGIFQILIGTWQDYECIGNRTDATDNIRCARKIYDARGTKDWNASKHAW